MTTPYQLDLIRHALGLPSEAELRKQGRDAPPAVPWRNCFAAYPEDKETKLLDLLVQSGLMVRRKADEAIFGDLIYYHATVAGFAAVGAVPNGSAKAAEVEAGTGIRRKK